MESTKITGSCKETNGVRVCINCRLILPTDVSKSHSGVSQKDSAYNEDIIPSKKALTINEAEGRVILSLKNIFDSMQHLMDQDGKLHSSNVWLFH